MTPLVAKILIPLASVFMVLVALAPLGATESPMLVFSVECEGVEDVVIYDLRVGWAHNLTRSPTRQFSADWSPDGSRIAFIAFESDRSGLFVMDSDGGNRQLVTANTNGIQVSPAWSPDGTRIAVEFRNFATNSIGIDIRDATDGYALIDHIASASYPAWSPDGTQLAFVSRQNGNSEIFIRDMATGTGRNLTRHSADESWPVWSADGREMLFVSDRSRSGRHIYRIAVETGTVQRLSGEGWYFNQPTWTGDLIAYQSTAEGSVLSDIFVMRADGSGVRRLTSGSCNENHPAWRP